MSNTLLFVLFLALGLLLITIGIKSDEKKIVLLIIGIVGVIFGGYGVVTSFL